MWELGLGVAHLVNKQTHAHLYTSTCLALPAGPASTCRLTALQALLWCSPWFSHWFSSPSHSLSDALVTLAVCPDWCTGPTVMEMWWLLAFSPLALWEKTPPTVNVQRRNVEQSKWLHLFHFLFEYQDEQCLGDLCMLTSMAFVSSIPPFYLLFIRYVPGVFWVFLLSVFSSFRGEEHIVYLLFSFHCSVLNALHFTAPSL
jgi:hypothetical protein